MNRETYNIDQVIKISLKNAEVDETYDFKSHKKYFLFGKKISYASKCGLIFNEEDLKKKFRYISDDKVYEQPRIKLFFNNDISLTLHSDTFEVAETNFIKLKDKIKNFIEIDNSSPV